MPITQVNAFGRKLKHLRLARGWTQQILADHSQLHRDSVVDLEHGYADPTLNTLKKLADALGKTVSELLEGI